LCRVHSQVLQNVAVRLDLAFKAFFRRCKAGGAPGYPRYRGQGRYNSMTFPQYGNGCQLTDGVLKLSKVGAVRTVQHRPLEGTPKTCRVRRSATGKWYVTIACEVAAPPLLPAWDAVGIDIGLASFYTLSTGEQKPCPQFLRTDEKDLKRTQRKLSAAAQGTPELVKRPRLWRACMSGSPTAGPTSVTRQAVVSSSGSMSWPSRMCRSIRWCRTTVWQRVLLKLHGRSLPHTSLTRQHGPVRRWWR
jgi:hypothetical protein